MPTSEKRMGFSYRNLSFWAFFTLGLASLGRAWAAMSGGLTLTAFVPTNYSVQVERIGPSVQKLMTSPKQDTELANIVEVNNTPGVFTVRISSLNHGVLNSESGTGPSYKLSYNDEPVNLNAEQLV